MSNVSISKIDLTMLDVVHVRFKDPPRNIMSYAWGVFGVVCEGVVAGVRLGGDVAICWFAAWTAWGAAVSAVSAVVAIALGPGPGAP
eukprot:1362148-Amorphochlora_amoeboformis.AAC.2